MTLDYPGELYSNRILEIVEPIFFISVQHDDQDEEGKAFVLGAYFELDQESYGAYYERIGSTAGQVHLFQIKDEGTGYTLHVIEDEKKYSHAFEYFIDRYDLHVGE